MKDLKFTPGPWVILTEGDEDSCILRTVTTGKRPRNLNEVALITTGSFPDDIEHANAQLISKAPEMYEALRQAKEALERIDTDVTIPELFDATKAAKEALETINKLGL